MASKKKESVVVVPKTAADIQRFKLEKLMKKVEKDVFIPEAKEAKLPRVFSPPECIRNVWGSSAGAGSGDFHVYRGVRRREYARQKFMNAMSDKNEKDDEFLQKLGQHKKEADEKTAKKRAKRLKKKAKQKVNKKPKEKSAKQSEDDSEEDEDEVVPKEPEQTSS